VLALAAGGQLLIEVLPRYGARSPSANRFILALLVALAIPSLGWSKLVAERSHTPPYPVVGASNWQAMAGRIDAPSSPFCVPVDPFSLADGWTYGIGCRPLAKGPPPDAPLVGLSVSEVAAPVPGPVHDGKLLAIGVPVRAAAPGVRTVLMRALVRDDAGHLTELTGERRLSPSGGLVLLNAAGLGEGIHGVVAVTLTSNQPVGIAGSGAPGAVTPALNWFGNP